MNRFTDTIFTRKKGSFAGAIGAALFIYSMFFNGLQSFADDDYDITGHYCIPDLKSSGKYQDLIQWKVTNIDEWNRFVNKLQELPPGKPVDNPLALGQDDLVHFTQVNPDKISGNDIYLSKAGIQQYARMPTDLYHYKNDKFRKFLEDELKKHPYGEEEVKKIKLTAAGIVVSYRGSSTLKNPTWVINDPKILDIYLAHLKTLVPLPQGETLRIELRKTVYDDVGTFILYLNYPGAPFQILAVTSEGGARGTTVNLRKFFFQDPNNYYAVFKQQAEDIIRGNDARRRNIDLNDATSRF